MLGPRRTDLDGTVPWRETKMEIQARELWSGKKSAVSHKRTYHSIPY